ncbi:LCP family protein [Trueperella bialowiezensis]|uniref:Biofilm regulatory protein A n=1 Tax=Trueperella bialowiezensis TaxID=312285 RepID=A0A3S4WFU3_9ACTO|nr:LCP family protein [Trueperella bialowiezensis]VEI12937.1 Biofilm regulatory protein A precursor [Trueperella bialowiezensis]
MTQPPSFEPRRRGTRPSADGAREVGRRSPEQSGAPRRRPVRKSVFDQHESAASSGIDGTQVQPVPGPANAERPPAYPPARRQQAAPAAPAAHATPPPAAPAHRPPSTPPPAAPAKARKRPSIGKTILLLLLILLVSGLAWGFYLYSYGNDRLTKVAALSGKPATPGTTFLIVGSDRRDDAVTDGTEGQRADTIMLLHKPESGKTALVSLPRDTLITYPDSENRGKLNGTYSYGGPEYLVQAVEDLTGLTVDHYVEIGMGGVQNLTDAVGGVELCLDYDVSDELSGLEWTAGCHHADGATALAFSRMRYSDPLGDIGRNERQRQVVSKIIGKALSPSILLNPIAQRNLVGSTADVLTVNEGANLMTVARAGLALRSAIGPNGLMGSPPIESLNHPGPGGSSTVLLAPESEQFWADLRAGTLTHESFASF